MKTSIEYKPLNGFLMILVVAVLGFASAYLPRLAGPNDGWMVAAAIIIGIIAAIMLVGFQIVNPNKAVVMTLFGTYKGTVEKNGFYWVNPFMHRKSISLRARNLEHPPIKVNDKLGNPIMIGAVVVWRVKDTYKSSFDVDNYESFVQIQSESAVRELAVKYPYDKFDDEEADISLRDGGDEVNHQLEAALQSRLEIAGIEIVESRIAHLAYASEIAGAMLQRQQATAIVAARLKIVEGAVGMVEMALEELAGKDIVNLSEEKKADMVSNLMVVLCAEKAATPMVNAGQ